MIHSMTVLAIKKDCTVLRHGHLMISMRTEKAESPVVRLVAHLVAERFPLPDQDVHHAVRPSDISLPQDLQFMPRMNGSG